MFDVVIHFEPDDEVVASTCERAFEREGWSVGDAGEGRAHVVIWSEATMRSERLAADARHLLDEGRLLQIFVQPPDARVGSPNVIEPPDPFCFFQGLPVDHNDLDGSDVAVDGFWREISEGSRVLAEIARLGELSRPADDWNARIVFSQQPGAKPPGVVVSEFGPGDHLLRRERIDQFSFVDTDFRTTIGSSWTVTLAETGEELCRVTIEDPVVRVTLPRRPPLWRRILKAPGPLGTLRVRGEEEDQLVREIAEQRAAAECEPEEPVQPQVFISYSRRDSDAAGLLNTFCQFEGWAIWWDPAIALGEDFRPRIDAAIDDAACVVVIWSERSLESAWVRHEAERGSMAQKLVDVELSPGLVGGALTMSERIHIDPARDELLARIAEVGGLTRNCDSWDSTLTVTNFEGQPIEDPIIGLEWVRAEDGEDSPWVQEIGNDQWYRLARRERWVEGASVSYRTTSGNFWIFGHEGQKLGRGCCYAKPGEHRVALPRRDRRTERKMKREATFTVMFSHSGSVLEQMDMNYPSAPLLD